jgi:hypothetical protein
MNTHAVHESIRLLPADSVAYGPKTRPLETHQRWAKATNDPQWAWRIACGYYESKELLSIKRIAINDYTPLHRSVYPLQRYALLSKSGTFRDDVAHFPSQQ